MYPLLTYGHWFRHLLYPMYNRAIRRDVFGVLAERLKTESLSAEAVRDLQYHKLKSVLVNAGARVPFYRQRFRQIGFEPRNLASIEEFLRLPIYVTKDEVRNNPSYFLADGCDRKHLHWHRTGGSTGSPLAFPTDGATETTSASSFVRALHWWGIDVGSRHAMFWGSPRFITRTPIDRLRKYTLGIRHRLMNRKFFANYNLNTTNMRRYRELLERFQPEYVRGMASSLFLFARFMLENDLKLDRGRPVMVSSACEQLFDWERDVIEAGFGAPVANSYGLCELADIAYGAPCGNLHVMDEDVLLELVPIPGSIQKEIVATQLNNMSSPLIRYRTGDIASDLSHGCACGRGLQILEGLQGRAHDFIVAPDGRFVHGQFFTHLLVFEKGIVKYQVIQEEKDLLVVKLVIDGRYSRESESRFLNAVTDYLGAEVRIEFEYVESIALTDVGKHRWIISKVASRQHDARKNQNAA